MKYLLVYIILFLNVNSLFCVEKRVENTFRIMSYNVRNGLDINGNNNRKNIAEIIDNISPDILSLQEVCDKNSQDISLKDFLSKECLMHLSYNNEKKDIAVLSKERPLNNCYINLPGNKGMLLVEFEDFFVCSIQLSQDLDKQKQSIPLIFSATENLNKPLFLAGNMNCDILSPSQIYLQTRYKLLSTYKYNTIAVENKLNLPLNCVDFIYGLNIDDNTAIIKSNVIEDKNSDHYAIYSDIRIPKAKNKIFCTEPYLQNPTNSGITICWETSVPTLSWVEYGIGNNLDKKKMIYINGQTLCNNFQHHFRLENLKLGETYNYRVCSQEIVLNEGYKKVFGNLVKSEIKSFKLPKENYNDCSFLVFNDLHNDFVLMDIFSKLIKDNGIKYDFVIYNGDCLDAPENKDEILKIINSLNNIANNKPYYFIRGNHEIRGPLSLNIGSYFESFSETTFGAFSWGNNRFVVLDCGEDKPDSTWVYYGLNNFKLFRENQAKFLVREKNNIEQKNYNKRILIHHIPIYTDYNCNFNPCFDLWGPILENVPFDLAINGHTHKFRFFEKDEINNPYPVIVGGGKEHKKAYMLLINIKDDIIDLKAFDTKGSCVFNHVLK